MYFSSVVKPIAGTNFQRQTLYDETIEHLKYVQPKPSKFWMEGGQVLELLSRVFLLFRALWEEFSLTPCPNAILPGRTPTSDYLKRKEKTRREEMGRAGKG